MSAGEVAAHQDRQLPGRGALGERDPPDVPGHARPHLDDLHRLEAARELVAVGHLPLERGQSVLLGFAPENLGRRVETLARVAHVESHEAIEKRSIGLEFLVLDDDVRDALRSVLRGVPPPLPARPTKPAIELVWIDMLVTWEEDLGDRVNFFEVSETMAGLDDGELVIETLAPMMTGGPGDYRWAH